MITQLRTCHWYIWATAVGRKTNQWQVTNTKMTQHTVSNKNYQIRECQIVYQKLGSFCYVVLSLKRHVLNALVSFICDLWTRTEGRAMSRSSLPLYAEGTKEEAIINSFCLCTTNRFCV